MKRLGLVEEKNTENFHNIMMHYILKKKASLVAQMVKHLLAMLETQLDPRLRKIPLEKGMATYSSILAWRISWIEEPDGL